MIARRVCLPLIFLACLVALSGCATNVTPNDAGSVNSPAADRYVAIEEHREVKCTPINSSDRFWPHTTHPSIFSYDGSENGSNPVDHAGWSQDSGLENDYYPAVNDTFKVLWGTTSNHMVSPENTRTSTKIMGVYSYPYVGQSGFVLQEVDRNGTVYGSYNDTPIVLRIGEQWYSPVTNTIKNGSAMGMDMNLINYTARFDTIWSLTNWGIFDKANLTRYNNSATAYGYNGSYEFGPM